MIRKNDVSCTCEKHSL